MRAIAWLGLIVLLASFPVVADELQSIPSVVFMCESQDPADDSQRTAIVNTSDRTLTIVGTDGRTEVEPIISSEVNPGIYVNRFGTQKSGPMLYRVVTSHHKLITTSFYASSSYLLSYKRGSVFNPRNVLYDDCARQ